ncbi:MAG: class I SAM-dependent methyltransferase [Flavobacteriales bacterium]|jgi:SAM-dependent methyltransferase
MDEKEWFASWFDTSYYHLLYNNRNEHEAHAFINRLVLFLELPLGSKVLDLACGKGRHARTLHALGFEVLGTDLSCESIEDAQRTTAEGLRFQVQDMREPIPGESFQAVFNLFTSFGYFEDTSENQRVIDSIYQMLLPKGLVVIDFLNAQKVQDTLVPSEHIVRGDITFEIHREINEGKVIKRIRFRDKGQPFTYKEQVQLLRLKDFEQVLTPHFNILHTFGDYELSAFNATNSSRLILIAQKK